MRTPAQAYRDAIKSGAVEAWNRGDKIQHREERAIAWDMWEGKEHQTPAFSEPGLVWRPAPTKRRIPFTQATIPKNALWRLTCEEADGFHVAICYRPELIALTIGRYTYEQVSSDLLYSLDGGATWQPGSQEVES